MGLDLRRVEGALPKLVGHRGALEVAPENTLASFQRALDDGVDVVEMDIRLSVDGHVVVMHDGTVDRTTNGTGVVSEMSLAELKHLDAGAWFDARYVGERIPTLAEVLAWARGKVGLLLELKYYPYDGFDPALVPATLDLIERAGVADQVAFISYQPKALAQVRAVAPNFLVGHLTFRDRRLNRMLWMVRRVPQLRYHELTGDLVRGTLLRPLMFAQNYGLNMLTPNIAVTTSELVAAAHASGMPVSAGGLAWDYPAAIAMGVDTVSANDPGRVRRKYLS